MSLMQTGISFGPTNVCTRDASICSALQSAGLREACLVEDTPWGRTLEISRVDSQYAIAMSGNLGFPVRQFTSAKELREILNAATALNHPGDVRPDLISAFEEIFAG